jgi:hypothetical protein
LDRIDKLEKMTKNAPGINERLLVSDSQMRTSSVGPTEQLVHLTPAQFGKGV